MTGAFSLLGRQPDTPCARLRSCREDRAQAAHAGPSRVSGFPVWWRGRPGRGALSPPHRIPPSPSLAAVPLLEVYMISRAPNRVQMFVYWRCLWLRQTAFCTLQVCRKGSSQNQPLLPPSSRRVWELASNSGKKMNWKERGAQTWSEGRLGGEAERSQDSASCVCALCLQLGASCINELSSSS